MAGRRSAAAAAAASITVLLFGACKCFKRLRIRRGSRHPKAMTLQAAAEDPRLRQAHWNGMEQFKVLHPMHAPQFTCLSSAQPCIKHAETLMWWLPSHASKVRAC